ncbi:MAG TPA: MazG family protein [Actinomycetota bacterium]|nr:MazG family protein [Actinomycetota bacterium]
MSRGQRLIDLVAVMDRLRSPGGCPWDAEQTHASLVQYLVEEAYETIEAIDAEDRKAMVEELGDLLLQVVFHARIGQEADEPFDIDDVAGGIADKLVARHPHVFGDETAQTAGDVEAAWFERKRREKGRTSVTDGVPMAMPALPLIEKLLHRAEKGGVPTPAVDPRVDALLDDLDPGEVVLEIVAAARARGIDADAAARRAARALRDELVRRERQ